MALAPLALVVFGVGRADDASTVLTDLAPAANSATGGGPGPWPAALTTADSATAATRPAATAATAGSTTTRPSRSAPRTSAARTPTAGTSSERVPAPGTPTATSTSTAPAAGVTAGAETLADVAYAQLSPSQKLDLYLPARTGRAVPLVVVIHGGAFMGGSKADDRGRAEALVARGYAVASLDYRLSEEAPFPAGAKDVKAAVRWLRAAAPRYGLDPNRFGAWGDSAGGYFAALLGATSGRPTDLDDPALGNPSVSSAVQAVVDFYGPVDFLTMDGHAASPGGCQGRAQVHDEAGSPESLWLGAPVQSVPSLARAAAPVSYLTGTGARPPFFIAHGLADCSVPHGQSLELAAALRARGVTSTVHLLPGMDHGDTRLDAQMEPLVTAFLTRYLPV